MDATPGAIVVAVGGHGWSAAVEYAAGEAVRRRRALHLVHAVSAEDPNEAVTGIELLADAVRYADALLDGLALVTASLVPGPAVQVLEEAAEQADLVVVGRRPESVRTQAYVHSVAGGVTARVGVPVVSVPDGWHPRVGGATVVAGIDDPEKRDEVLAAAFVAALERRARLVVVAAVWRPPQTHVDDQGWQQRLEEGLARALADAAETYGEVPVEIHVRNTHADEALIEASCSADLVVVGRHAGLVPGGLHLGPIARAVVRRAECPVQLAIPRSAHRVRAAAVRS